MRCRIKLSRREGAWSTPSSWIHLCLNVRCMRTNVVPTNDGIMIIANQMPHLKYMSSRAVPRRAFTKYFPTLNPRSNCLRLGPLAVWRRWNMLNPGKPLLSNRLMYVWWGFRKNWLQVCRMCSLNQFYICSLWRPQLTNDTRVSDVNVGIFLLINFRWRSDATS